MRDPFKTTEPTCIKAWRANQVRQVDVTPALIASFWNRVKKGSPSECWEWQGHICKTGYGTLSAKFKQGPIKAHRISYAIHNGNIPEWLFVLHHCDNPKCVNPDRLYAGDEADNMRDAVSRGRAKGGAKTVRFGSETTGAKLNEEKVRAIISSLSEMTNAELSIEYGVARRTIADIRNRKSRPKVCGELE